jgi:NAD(P)-dependent dehydrogenase (short-subunit alcohol dehydrogenase family)
MRGTIIVTGGGRGIGAAIARRLGADGYGVAVNYLANATAAQNVADEIVAAGGRAKAIQGDVAMETEIARLFATAEADLGPLAGLVNNAGLLGVAQRLESHDAASLQQVFATNIVGAMLCAKEAVRRLSTRHGGKGGAIVNIGSIAATTGGIPGMVAYATSKGALAAFTLALAKEVAREGIRVNAVAPGLIVTEMTAGVAAEIGPTVPLGRCGRPDEIAAAVAWLLSDEASYAVGSVLTISGGR